VDIFYN